MTATTEAELYLRLPGESRQAYASFVAYRDLGEARSLVKVGQKLGKSTSLLERWSARWRWVERAEAFDAFLDRQRCERAAQAVREMAERHAAEACLAQQRLVERLNRVTDADLDKMTWHQVGSLLKIATQIERDARGTPDVVTQSQTGPNGGPTGGPIPVEVVETLVVTREDVAHAVANPQGELLIG
jgi:hypothetical protein